MSLADDSNQLQSVLTRTTEKEVQRLLRRGDATEASWAKFEDRVRRLMILAGAQFVSLGPASVSVDPDPDSPKRLKSFDCIAKIDGEVFFIECKHGAAPQDSMDRIIRAMEQERKFLNRVCAATWDGARAQVCWAFDRARYNKPDMELAEAKGIRLLTPARLRYYDALVDLMGKNGRFQIFADLLNGEDFQGDRVIVPALKGNIGSITFYSFLAQPSLILPLSYVHHRRAAVDEYESAYQRTVRPEKIRAIRDFVRNNGFFPNSVIINLSRTASEVKKRGVSSGVEAVLLELPRRYGSCWIIDGQHRLLGYSETAEAQNHLVPFLALSGATSEFQGKLFVDINANQTPVPKNLLWDLYSDLYAEATDQSKQALATISQVAKKLNRVGPLKHQIQIISQDSIDGGTAAVTMDAICNSIARRHLIRISPKKTGLDKHGLLYRVSYANSVDLVCEVVSDFFVVISKHCEQDWTDSERGFARSNAGIRSLFYLLEDVVRFARMQEGDPIESEARRRDFFEKYVSPAAEYIATVRSPASKPNASPADKDAWSAMLGVSGEGNYQRLAKKLSAEIHRSFEEYNYRGLGEDEESAGEDIDLHAAIRSTELRSRAYLHKVLSDSVGPGYWKLAIPTDIKTYVDKIIDERLKEDPRLHEDDFSRAERRIDLITFGMHIHIIESKPNWPYFERALLDQHKAQTEYEHATALRNQLSAHPSAVGGPTETVVKHGEAAITWLNAVFDRAKVAQPPKD